PPPRVGAARGMAVRGHPHTAFGGAGAGCVRNPDAGDRQAEQQTGASLPAVIVVIILAAIVGDTVGYEIGRTGGTRVLRWRVLDKRRKQLDSAQDFLARRGGSAVVGRWIAFFRAVMPFLAGSSRMHYPKFLAYNAAGGIAWGATVTLLGYAAGASYAKVEKTFGRDAAFAVAGVAVVALVIWRVRKHLAERRSDAPNSQ
ncbi:MAG: DedA family protein, partial [Actinomycetales bacterium]